MQVVQGQCQDHLTTVCGSECVTTVIFIDVVLHINEYDVIMLRISATRTIET
jgi:hypothetical protein